MAGRWVGRLGGWLAVSWLVGRSAGSGLGGRLAGASWSGLLIGLLEVGGQPLASRRAYVDRLVAGLVGQLTGRRLVRLTASRSLVWLLGWWSVGLLVVGWSAGRPPSRRVPKGPQCGSRARTNLVVPCAERTVIPVEPTRGDGG